MFAKLLEQGARKKLEPQISNSQFEFRKGCPAAGCLAVGCPAVGCSAAGGSAAGGSAVGYPAAGGSAAGCPAAGCPAVAEQVELVPELMTKIMDMFFLMTVTGVQNRGRISQMCYVAACIHFVVPVYGQDGETNHSAVSGTLWALLAVIIIMLAVCYRFEIWRTCFKTVHKCITLSRCDHSSSVVRIKEEVVSLKEEEPVAEIKSAEPEKVYPDIHIADFIDHVKRLRADSDHGFSQEFAELGEESKKESFSADNFSLEKNKDKNRYRNILAYDHSRVILKVDDFTTDQSDYINANYVHGYQKPIAYIATQGPLPQTVDDFWRMVWEQKSDVIVMITNLKENGMNKCECYWPLKGENIYGNIMVRLISTELHAFHLLRVFLLKNVKCCSVNGVAARTVYHYHYTQWPDHGVPDYPLPVLSFVQKSTAHNWSESGPIIVHCSAGVGRTGTYILIDSMIAQIMDKRCVNIPDCVRNIRRQRNFLVQTEIQYKFIHEVLVEYLLGNGCTEVSQEQMSGYLFQLELPFRSTLIPHILHVSLLEKLFQQITEYVPKQFELSAALEPFNQTKNREGGLLPVCSSRVLLPVRPAVAGSDYINATFLQGYSKAEEFIVAQHPTEDTVKDFWRMVCHVHSPVIVILTALTDKENNEFWPSKGASTNLDMDGFCISTKRESLSNYSKGFVTLEIVVTCKENDVDMLTKIMIVKDWMHSYKKLHRIFDPISAAHTYLPSSECGPVIVVDRFGGVEAGTFCALWTLRDQLLSERCADFYQVCKLYHYKRPGIFRSQDNYLLLHRAMAALCKHLESISAGKHRFNQHQNFNQHHRFNQHQNFNEYLNFPSYHDQKYSRHHLSRMMTKTMCSDDERSAYQLRTHRRRSSDMETSISLSEENSV